MLMLGPVEVEKEFEVGSLRGVDIEYLVNLLVVDYETHRDNLLSGDLHPEDLEWSKDVMNRTTYLIHHLQNVTGHRWIPSDSPMWYHNRVNGEPVSETPDKAVSKIFFIDQMKEEYGKFCTDLASDGHVGNPIMFVEVMWEWELDGARGYRLTDRNLIRDFLKLHAFRDDEIDELIEWTKRFER